MNNKKVYLLFVHTGSLLSSLIQKATGDRYSHISISFDPELKEVYSFGRKRPRNPLIAGFVREDIENGTLSRFTDVRCEIREIVVTNKQYKKIKKEINKCLLNSNLYRYNFIGLVTAWRGYPLERENAYFCSQFISKLFQRAGINLTNKDINLTTPMDILGNIEDKSKLVYSGTIADFKNIANSHRVLNDSFSASI